MIDQFKKDKKELLIKSMNESGYLENLCGVKKMIDDIKYEDIDIIDNNDF